jgi:hypothetical protein
MMLWSCRIGAWNAMFEDSPIQTDIRKFYCLCSYHYKYILICLIHLSDWLPLVSQLLGRETEIIWGKLFVGVHCKHHISTVNTLILVQNG